MNEPAAWRETVKTVEARLGKSGLAIRGILSPAGSASADRDSHPGVAILIGHGGGGFWPVFEAWHRMRPDLADPLDAWSKAVIEPIALETRGEAVFPSDRPHYPFQRWAMAAEGMERSPLQLLIHPRYGLWHGYRGAILYPSREPRPAGAERKSRAAPHPCKSCAGRPCLSACPVGAFTATGFDAAACQAHLSSAAGREGCMESGCRARNACPVGADHRYGSAQMRFHMRAFAQSERG